MSNNEELLELVTFFCNTILKNPNQPINTGDRRTTEAVNKVLRNRKHETRVISISDRENYILISGYGLNGLKDLLQNKIERCEEEAEAMKRKAERLKAGLETL